jgi:hypothetical protein
VCLPFDAIALIVVHAFLVALFDGSNAVPLVFLAGLGVNELGQMPKVVKVVIEDLTRLVHIIVAGLRD